MRALESVYRQTCTDYEILIVDDGSTDGTEQMLKANGYAGRYYWFDRMGQQSARNKLIELARGEYITYLDSDDELFPNALEVLSATMEANGRGSYVFGHYVGIDENGREIPKRRPKVSSPLSAADLFSFIHVGTGGTLFATENYRKEGGFDENMRRCGVYKLQLQLILKYRFVGTAAPLFRKRRHGGNATEMNYDWRMIEARMLEDFYYHGGGRAVVPARRAKKRLAEEFYRAGKCAVKEGRRTEALSALRRSLRYHPDGKVLFWLLAAQVKRGDTADAAG
ncbi:MAG: glycosyltransferase [Sedimentisphaerales bacterium]|nr:glycosyltransferase [Sedimentisphaerales bacterium]